MNTNLNPLSNPLPNQCQMSSLENFVMKYLQFYPNLLSQTLNYPANILTKSTSELLANWKQYNLYASSISKAVKDMTQSINSGNCFKRSKQHCIMENKSNADLDCNQNYISHSTITPISRTIQSLTNLNTSLKDTKRINEIVKCLKNTTIAQQDGQNNPGVKLAAQCKKAGLEETLTSPPITETSLPSIPTRVKGYAASTNSDNAHRIRGKNSSDIQDYNIYSDIIMDKQQNIEVYNVDTSNIAIAVNSSKCETKPLESISGQNTFIPCKNKATANSKLYATCFVCHKQLSNRYNLRVHLETHQTVR